jgi:hypothetical protein
MAETIRWYNPTRTVEEETAKGMALLVARVLRVGAGKEEARVGGRRESFGQDRGVGRRVPG